MDNRLLPCPFCGAIPQITTEKRLSSLEFNTNYPKNGRGLYIQSEWYLVECVCMRLVKAYKTEAEAITAWNTRTLPDEITAKLSRLAEYDALRPDVLTFAKAMEMVLKKHDDRPGWEGEPYDYLTGRLDTEYREYKNDLPCESDIKYYGFNYGCDAKKIQHELIDVANFCMMLFCNIERDAAAQKGEGE